MVLQGRIQTRTRSGLKGASFFKTDTGRFRTRIKKGLFYGSQRIRLDPVFRTYRIS